MSNKRKMLLLTLIGFIIPFGNVIAPYFISCRTLPELKFRKSLTIIETLIAIIPMAISVCLIICAAKDGATDTAIEASEITKAIAWLPLTPIGIIATIIALWQRAKQ